MWLADDNVRLGIRAILARDRCDEELSRLKHENRSLREWFLEEWAVVNETIDILQEIDSKCSTLS